jgi:hypothetical protein
MLLLLATNRPWMVVSMCPNGSSTAGRTAEHHPGCGASMMNDWAERPEHQHEQELQHQPSVDEVYVPVPSCALLTVLTSVRHLLDSMCLTVCHQIFRVAGCLTVVWSIVVEFLRPWWNSMLTIVMCHSSFSWFSAKDHHLLPLWMVAFWTGIACPSETSSHRSIEPWVYQDESQCFLPTWHASVNALSSYI